MKSLIVLDSLPSWAFVLIIVGVFGVIVLGVILIKKYSPHFKNTEKPKSEEEIAQEEVDRLVVPMDENNKSLEEVNKEKAEAAKAPVEEPPTSQEAATYESHRATTSEENPDFERQMKEYAAQHPEEEQAASEASKKTNK